MDTVRHPKERQVLARLCLNIVFDPEQFPVQLSEVLNLSVRNVLLARALMAWAAVKPTTYGSWSETECAFLIDVATTPLVDRPKESCDALG